MAENIGDDLTEATTKTVRQVVTDDQVGSRFSRETPSMAAFRLSGVVDRRDETFDRPINDTSSEYASLNWKTGEILLGATTRQPGSGREQNLRKAYVIGDAESMYLLSQVARDGQIVISDLEKSIGNAFGWIRIGLLMQCGFVELSGLRLRVTPAGQRAIDVIEQPGD